MKKWIIFIKLLTTKGYRKVIIIPLVFFLGFFIYNLYTDFTGGTPEKIIYDDGTMRIHAQSELGSCKLPEILDSLNIPIHNDLKIKNYSVYLDKNNELNSVEIYCSTDKKTDEIINWYKDKLNSSNEANEVEGIWRGFEMSIRYQKYSDLFAINLKK